MKRVNVLPKLSRGFSLGVGQFQSPGLHTLVSCDFALDLALDSLYRSDALYISVYIYVPCFFSDSSCFKCPSNTVCNSGVCQCRRGYIMNKRNCIRKSTIIH